MFGLNPVSMRIVILDPAAGISGDMMLGALIGAGLDAAWLEGLPARVGFPDVGVRVHTVNRASLNAVKVDFDIRGDPGDHRGHGRTVGDLIALVRRADVSEPVQAKAVRAFELLGEAEGRVHGVAPEAVHLHEVGAIDAVLDIVGAVEGIERLGVEAVYNRPVAIGRGWVEVAHGSLPVPAPATLALLEGFEVASGGPIVGEATTPTGAVLLRVLSSGPPPERWRVLGSGWGAGTRDDGHWPNALRIIVAEAAAEAGAVEVIVTDVDDMTPEYLEPLRQAVFDAGAMDCQTWSSQGKKGRSSVRIEVLAPVTTAEEVVAALFAHGTTAGLRRWPAWRSTLARREIAVELDGPTRVRVKVRDGPQGQRVKAEYDDVVLAAKALNRSALDIAREAERRAEQLLSNTGSGQ